MKHFLSRLLSSAILLGLLAYCVSGLDTPRKAVFISMAAAAVCMAVLEFCIIMNKGGKTPVYSYFAAIMTASATVFATFKEGVLLSQPAILLSAVAMIFWILFLVMRKRENNIQALLNTAGVFLIFSVPACVMVKIFLMETSGSNIKWIFLYFILVTKAGDIGAYVTGSITHKLMKNGNHKMIPSVSPGKSWEGLAGGLVWSVAASILIAPQCFSYSGVIFPIIAGVIFFFGGAAGDLAESAFKRAYNVKDSGVKLPGIGGVLDLVDSLMINAPLFYIFIKIYNLM